MRAGVRRLGTDEQRGAAVELLLRGQPHLVRPEVTMLVDDATSPDRLVVGVDGDDGLVAVGITTHLVWQVDGDQLVSVVVDPAARGRGLGTRVHTALLAGVPGRATRLRTTTFDDDPASGEVADHWGYHRLQLSISSIVDVGDATDPVLPDGVTVETTDHVDLPDTAAVDRMLDVSQTNPERLAGGSVVTLADLAQQQEGDRLLLGVLRVAGEPAAICAAMHDSSGVGYVGYTGVHPAHRGRGLGSLVKRAVHAEARRRGVRHLATDNEQHNAGIRHVNEQLGYRVQFGTWRWARPV